MAGITTNYKWNYVDSGADPVSGPQNFAFVPQIDTTLKQLHGNVRSMRAGSVGIGGGCVTTVRVNVSPSMIGDNFYAQVTMRTSVPGTVQAVAVLNETSTGFDVIGCRANDTGYNVSWIFVGITAS